MAFETEYSNIIKNTDVISNGLGPALVTKVVGVPLIYAEDLPINTNKKLARKNGRLVAEVLAETTAYTASASSELTQTSVDCVAQKHVVVSELTAEAMRFTPITPEQVTQMMADALGRDLDEEIVDLIPGFSQSVTSGSVATVSDFMDAAFQIDEEEAEKVGGNLRVLIDKKAAHEISKELVNSSAAVFSQEGMISLLSTMKAPNGYIGSLPGMDFFAKNTKTDSGKRVSLVFNPDIAFFSMYDTQPSFAAIERRAEGFYLELSAYLFAKVVEWYDVAGCQVRSNP